MTLHGMAFLKEVEAWGWDWQPPLGVCQAVSLHGVAMP